MKEEKKWFRPKQPTNKSIEDKWKELLSGGHVLDPNSPPQFIYTLVQQSKEKYIKELRMYGYGDMLDKFEREKRQNEEATKQLSSLSNTPK